MHERTREFVEFMVRCDVLTFGDFVAKSGRRTPYFVNAGRYRTGTQVAELGRFYAATIAEAFGDGVDVLFGPAYKGIPLAVTTAIALAEQHGHDVGFCFDRKEAKDHGEGGQLVGHPLADGDRVVIVEDVTTAGTSIRSTVPLLRATADVEVVGLVVGVDRRERGGRDEVSALDELADEFGFRAVAIATIDDVVSHLRDHDVDGRKVLGEDDLERIAAYRGAYGVA
ncbi:MAG TPA: orotate phosphoribosyltransferase [Egicoccus sp.]|nr:orotate phosphoribosyltransferase [Egicoccus sp.]HSK23110.1 orotate phosphoribosyltransferase [Egicoccus sp.]